MPQKEQTSNNRKIFKISGIVLICVLGLIFLLSILFLSLIDPIAAKYIKQQVNKQSDGQYKIEFEDFDLSLFNRSATFNNFHLIPDTALIQNIQDSEKSMIIADIEVQKLTVKRINFVDAILHNKIKIGSLSLNQPLFNILSKKASLQDDNKQKNPYFLNGLDEVSISEIEILEGKIKYSDYEQSGELRHHVPLLNLLVYDFSINNDADNIRGFKADDIIIKVKDYEYNNSDDDLSANISLFDFSSKTGELVVESMFIKSHPEHTNGENSKNLPTQNYNLTFPRIAVSGIDYDEILNEKKLHLKNFVVEKANISFEDQTESSLDNPGNNLKLMEELSKKVQEIQIEQLNIQEAHLEYTKSHSQQEVVHHLDGFDFLAQSLQINLKSTDSVNFLNVLKNIKYTAAKVDSDKYFYSNTLTPYILSTSSISWASENNIVQIDSFSLKGDWEKNWELQSVNASKPMVFDIDASQIKITDVNFQKILSTSNIDLGIITLAEPHIELLVEKNLTRKIADLQSNEVVEEFKDFINILSIDEIKIQDASFTHFARERNKKVRKIQELGNASVIFQNFEIDSLNSKNRTKKLPLQKVYLIAHFYKYWTPDNIHYVTLDKVKYQTDTRQLTASAINIDYDTTTISNNTNVNSLRSLYDVKASSFIITGLELLDAINSGALNVDEITLNNPDLKVLLNRNINQESKNNSINVLNDLYSFVNPITVRKLNLEGGVFEFREKREEVIRTHLLEHASATVTNIRLNPNKVSDLKEDLPFHNILLLARDYTYKSPDKIYSILLDSLKYSSSAQILTANFIKVQSDKAENIRLKKENIEKANRNLFDISADKFQVTGLDLAHAYETGEYFMKELRIEEPRLSILQDKDVPAKKNIYEKIDNSKVMGQVAKIVETFFVENLHIINGTLNFNTVQNSLPELQTIDHISFTIEKLRLASLETNDPLEMFEVDELMVQVRDFEHYLPDSLYLLRIGEVSSSLNKKTIYINDVQLKPTFNKDEYSDYFKYATDLYNIVVSNIELQNINMLALFNKQEIRIGKSIIDDASVKIFRDERLEIDPERKPETLQGLLRKSDIYIKADTILVKNSNLAYTSITPSTNEKANLLFENIFLKATNVTNDSLLIDKRNITEIEARAQFMGESLLKLNMDIYLDDPDDLYVYEGTLNAMDLTDLNPIFEDLIPLRIEDGLVQRVSFSVSATREAAKGNMQFYYDDLELQLIDKENPQKSPGLWLKTGSWLVNTFMVKSQNPTKRGKFRNGEIEVQRDFQRSIFKNMGDAMIDGVSSSIMTPFVEKVVYMFVGD